MRIYLAGPMTGIPEFNFPEFDKAAAKLRGEGHEVYSPADQSRAEHGEALGQGNLHGDERLAAKMHGFDRRKAMKQDLAWICDHAEALALLPGWRSSKGAMTECCLAQALGLKIIGANE